MGNYRELDGLNQSLLKKILVSPAAFIKQRDKQGDSEKDHFVFGSLVDDMLLSDFDLDEKYFIMEDSKLSDVLKSVTRYMFDYINNCKVPVKWNTVDTDAIIIEACDEYDYQPRWKTATRIKNIKEKCEPYYLSLVESKGKIIIPEVDYYKATVCVAALKTDTYTKKYFSKEEHVEVWKHKVITFTLKGIDFKGELDKVFIDHAEKTIEPIDYKTTGKTIYGFRLDFWKFRYDFQSAVYFYGISKDPEVKKLLDKGYKLLHFKYIVVETEMHNSPMIFKVSNATMDIGWKGGTLSSGRYYEGFLQALDRFIFHKSTDTWDYPMEYYKKGYLDIEI